MKIRTIKYGLSALCAIALMGSCNLDADMYNAVNAENLDPRAIKGLTLGNYRLLKNENGIVDNGYRFWAYGADDLSWGGTSTDGMFAIYDYRRNVNSTRTEYAYELGYRLGANACAVIEQVIALGDNRSLEETVLMGENYYLRALTYFLLVNEFAQPYANNNGQNPGVVLKLTADPDDLPATRSTVAEVYAQIELDLLDAIKYMTIPKEVQPKSNIYATKEAAEALLSRVYLYMDRWEDARKYADNVIKSGRFELVTGDFYTKYPQHVPESNNETIFAVRLTMDKDRDDASCPGGMFYRIDNSGWEEIYPSSRYMTLIELHPEDLRNKFIVKRITDEKQLRFNYARPKAGTIHYEYGKIKVEKQANGSYTIMEPTDAALFTSATIQSESYNLGKRYYVIGKYDNIKYVGLVEPTIKDSEKNTDYLVYAINKMSYQEQRKHLWSPVISRLAEMYLIRAEANAKLGNLAEALADVNIIRSRSKIPVWTMDNMKTAEIGADGKPAPKSIHKIIEEERMLELAWEGHRRFDVFRNRQTMDRKYPGGHTSGAAATVRLEIPYNDAASCEFLPQAQLDIYPHKLEQNP